MNSMKKSLTCLILLIVIMAIFSTYVCAKNYVWKCMIPASGTWDSIHFQDLADGVKAATNGQLEIQVFQPGEHPYKMQDLLTAVSKGEVEMASFCGAYIASIEPRLAVMELPFLMADGSFETSRKVYTNLRKGYFKDVLNEWGVHELATVIWGAQQVFLKNSWVENEKSLLGKKIRGYGSEVSNAIEMMGGIPLTIPLSEMYTSLSTGLCDGLVTSFTCTYNLKLLESTKNISMVSMNFCPSPYVVNNKVWDALPADLQKTVKEYFESKRDWFECGSPNEDGTLLQQAFLTFGIEARPVPSDYRHQLVLKAYDKIWKPWLDRTGKKGREAFDQIVEQLKELGYEVPLPKDY